MSHDKVAPGDAFEETFESNLLAYDEALAAGATPPPIETAQAPPQLVRRLLSARHCLGLLERERRKRNENGDSVLRAVELASEAAWASAEPISGQTVGRFEIERELGRGGYGVVLLAHDPVLKRRVALKVPRPEVLLTSDLSRRFLREAQAAGSLQHPNLVSVYEVGEDGPLHYIASAYCEGPTLAEWLRGAAQVPIAEAVRIVAAVADGVSEAHEQGILHRDIKPGNILLEPRRVVNEALATPQELAFTPKLTDFGLAKLAEFDREATRSGVLLGTPAYMAPEQATGRLQDVCPATDVYALGAVLYELLTGHRAFQGASDVDTLRLVVDADPKRPRQLRPEISRDLEAVCLKCLEKEPAKRYPSAAQLAADLRRCLSGEPTLARPLSTWQTLSRWGRRRPAAAALVALSVGSTLLLFGLLAWHSATLADALEATRLQRDEAQRLRVEADQSTRRATAQEAIANRHLYSLGIRLAHGAIDQGDVAEGKQLLDLYAPESANADLRGFEWDLLRSWMQREKYVLITEAEAYTVAFSPDGKVLATGAENGRITLWEAETGRLIEQFEGHSSCVNKLSYSPDGSLLASGGCDNAVRLWGLKPRRELATLLAHDHFITTVAFSPSGEWLAAVADDGLVVVWETSSQKIVHRVQIPGAGQWLAWSPDGSRLAAGTTQVIQIWETPTWSERAPLPIYATSGAFCRDSRSLLLSLSNASSLVLCDPEEPQHRMTVISNLTLTSQLAISPSGTRLALSPRIGLIELLDPQKVIAGWPADPVEAVNFARHPPATPYLTTFAGHRSAVKDLTFSPDGRLLASASRDGTVRVWESELGGGVTPFVIPLDLEFVGGLSRQVAMNSELTQVYAAVFEQPFFAWDVSRPEKPVALPALPNSVAQATQIAPGPDPDSVLCADVETGKIYVWNVAENRERTVVHLRTQILRFEPSRDGTAVATLGEDRVLRVHDVRTGELRLQCLARISAAPVQAATDIEALQLYLTARGERLFAWPASLLQTELLEIDSRKFQLDTTLRETSPRDSTPDGRMMVSTQGTALIVSDADSLEVISRARLTSVPAAAAISPNGRTVATLSEQGRIKLWNVETGQELFSLASIPGGPLYLRFSADGKRLAAITKEPSSTNGHLFLWSTESPR